MLLGAFVVLGAIIAIAWSSFWRSQKPQPIPSVLYGPLFVAVQTRMIFSDSKIFCDAVPLSAPVAIVSKFESLGADANLTAFVLENFAFSPSGVVHVPGNMSLSAHIAWLWPRLARYVPTSNSSALGLPYPYVVPGGRFGEIYYWDSFFTMLGLQAANEMQLVQDMLQDFSSLISEFGFVPNGSRNYYLSRSQPPFFLSMVKSFAARPSDYTTLVAAEYSYWMQPERLAVMPDGSVVNIYWDALDIPRDESFAEDLYTSKESGNRSGIFRDIRAAAASGWDFSSRWLRKNGTLSSIQTTQIVPVDLNALLWGYEVWLGKIEAANRRASAVAKWLYCTDINSSFSFYCDFDLATASKRDEAPTAAALMPLFVGLADEKRAAATALSIEKYLLASGGILTTTVTTGQQWDAPNGWAPLQWVAVEGLEKYHHTELARKIGSRFLNTVESIFNVTGKLVEKYDVRTLRPGGGGEYSSQDGFGWTNGVVAMFLRKFGSGSKD